MAVFNHYAQYYDLLYSNKNYKKEVDYIDTLIRKYAPESTTILDLGCGTGTHDFFLAKKNYQITGVDLSQNMVDIAEHKRKTEKFENLNFVQGNIVDVNMNKEFDVVVSLFHVMNYLTSTEDMWSGFRNAVNHIKKGGLLIFDCWYGPAVLTDLPKAGVKNMENEFIKVTRNVQPVIHENRNVVDVNYEILVEEIATGKKSTIQETHSVRYFFRPEIELIFERIGIELLSVEEWITGNAASMGTFGVCFVGRKK